MENDKILEVYNYAKKHVKYFERDPEKQMDLVHDAILKLLMHPNNEDMEFPKAYVIKIMKFRYMNLRRTPKATEMPFPYFGAGEGVSYKVLNYGGSQLQDIEAYVDTCTILDFIKEGKFTKSNNKGKVYEIFSRYLKGYTHVEIAEELGIGKVASSTSWSLTQKRIKTMFSA